MGACSFCRRLSTLIAVDQRSDPVTLSPARLTAMRNSSFSRRFFVKLYGSSLKRLVMWPLMSCSGSQSKTVYTCQGCMHSVLVAAVELEAMVPLHTFQ